MIHIVAAVILDANGRMLLVRKRGSLIFIQPGGKREPGESSLETLTRELREELGVQMSADTAQHLGEFEDIAVNEPGQRVRAKAFVVEVDGMPTPGAEIAEIRWVHPTADIGMPIAPMSRHRIFPEVARWSKEREKKRKKAQLDEPVMQNLTFVVRCLTLPAMVAFGLLALPIVGNLVVISGARALGCATGEDREHPCTFLAWQVGDLVSGYTFSAFIGGAANPLLAGFAFFAFLRSWFGILWMLALGGTLIARRIRRRKLLGG